MEIWAVAMVRNESDIIEAFVRHNLAFVDGVAVIDHGSSDRTFDILCALKDEGLPVVRVRTQDRAFFQGTHVSAVTRECFHRTGADFVFALDADEFLHAASRGQLEAALRAMPEGVYGLQRWRSYVPTHFMNGFGAHCMRRRVREEKVARAKVIVPRAFLERPHHMVAEGNHWVVDTRTNLQAVHHVIDPDDVCIAHCPVRSAAQLGAKARRGYDARLATGSRHPKMSTHWRDICEHLDTGLPLDEERLKLIAMNYTVPREEWEERDLVEDPVQLRVVRGPRVRSAS